MTDHDLTTADAAIKLRTTPPTICKMCANGELRGAYRLTSKPQSPWRIPPEAIEEHRRRKAGTYAPRSRKWREQALDAA